VWKLDLKTYVETRLGGSVGTGLGASVENGLRVYWSFIWLKRTINLRNIIQTNLCIFFLIFFLLKRKDSITIHMSKEGFDWKGGKYFIQKDEWLMYAWLGMMYEIPYVWFFLLHFFWKQIWIDYYFIAISNSWTILLWNCLLFQIISLV